MLKGFTGGLARLLLAAALVCASAAVGLAAPARRGNPACPLMSRAHACCKRARKAAEYPRLLPVRLCCVTDAPQPAPAGTSHNARPAPGVATDPHTAFAAPAPAHVALHARAYAPTFSPAHS
ncbi:MAG TPA: hypothetical protein VN282_10435, partial [Pyrinomonadaceae bacterium]|nr:hypothetical protein [Pyrinomonadaceae bacterium]